MRQIDADALKAYIDAQIGRPFIGCTVGEALKILVDEQPTVEAEPKWIPVSERLPDVDFPGEIKVMGYDGKTECINADYLISKPVAAKGKDGKPIIAIYEVDDDKRKYWVNDADGTITDGITEWAPLPESYK
jgi:hypothetical protein